MNDQDAKSTASYDLPGSSRAGAAPSRPVVRQSGRLDPLALRLFAGFEVKSLLGQGGMGAVYLAHDPQAGRDVALKVLHGRLDGSALTRFKREAQLAASLDQHAGIVKVHSAGDFNGTAWIAFERVEGARTLADACAGLAPRERLALVRDAARALGFAHRRGVVHRDVKPGNVLVDSAGRARLTDFGLSVACGQQRLTETGTIVGTPEYMAPELLRSLPATPASDVWALGVLLFEALTGAVPFEGDTLACLAVKILTEELVLPAFPEAPAGVDLVLRRCLARPPAERYPDGDAVADDIDGILRGEAPARSARRRRRSVIALAALGVVSIAVSLVASAAIRPAPYDATQWARRDPEGLLRPAGAPVAPTLRGATRAASTPASPDAPAWFTRLPASKRPTLPLAEGLRFGDAHGEYVNAVDGQVLVWVPAARFAMGSLEGDPDERPVRDVTLSRGLFLGKTEITWGQYVRFFEATGRRAPVNEIDAHPGHYASGADEPVFHVTWDDARAYCAWAGGRLPTEAEWELAARGPEGRRYPWGDHLPAAEEPAVANIADDSIGALAPGWLVEAGYDDGAAYLCAVGRFPAGASPVGCLDMAGNVWEWVEDTYGRYAPSDVLDPCAKDAEATERVVRGGSWCYPVHDCRGASRSAMDPAGRYDAVGFRLAR